MADLCTLAQVKQYMKLSDTTSDLLLQGLITAYSARVSTYCGRRFDPANFAEIRNGTGQRRLMLRQWPVTAVSSITVGSTAIPAAGNVANSGYRNVDAADVGDGRLLVLSGYTFDRGYSNVQINYTAGYAPVAVTGEVWNIPAVSPYTVTLLNALGYVGGDSITFVVGGTPLLKVAGNPGAGQYSITTGGVITFNSADAGKAVSINYNVLGYPADLTQAVIELVALRFKSRDWTGYNSKSLAGETVAFTKDDLPDTIKNALAPHQSTMIPQ